MKRVLLPALIAGVLTIGSFSALAAAGQVGPVTNPVATDDGVTAQDADPDDDDGAAVSDENGDDGQGAERIAGLIEETFGADEGSVLALHDEGIGFGALFKLHLLAAATDTSVDDLLAAIASDEDGDGFAFGKLFKENEEALTALADESGAPKNLGHLVSAANKADKATDSVPDDAGTEETSSGPPPHAPAHGRR